MSRYSLIILLVLAIASVVVLGAAGRDWVSLWQGFDRLAMSVDTVEFDENERRLIVSTTVVNESDQRLRIHVLSSGLRLSGRSIAGGSERYTELVLAPGETRQLQTAQRVQGEDVGDVTQYVDTQGATWDVSGRIQVSVEGLSEPQWLPFRFEVRVDQ